MMRHAAANPAAFRLVAVVSLLMSLASPVRATAGQNVGLKIVVIAGEAAVNIIQQKTAVTPLVEVRSQRPTRCRSARDVLTRRRSR